MIRRARQVTYASVLAVVTAVFSFAGTATPAAIAAPAPELPIAVASQGEATASDVVALGLCVGSTTTPTLEVVRDDNGNPRFRRVNGYATQSCGSGIPYSQQLCIKIQEDVNFGGSSQMRV